MGAYYSGFQGWEFSVEGYYKQMNNILEYQDGVSFLVVLPTGKRRLKVERVALWGQSLCYKKQGEKLLGWLAYTLAKVIEYLRRVPLIMVSVFRINMIADIVSLCANHDFNQRIDVGATWTLNSGGTITVPEIQTVVIKPNGELMQSYISKRNNYRLPISHRLNIGVNFNKKTKHGIRTWNISVYNL